MRRIKLNLKDRSYCILIGRSALGSLAEELRFLRLGRDAFIITNPKIRKLHGQKLQRLLRRAGCSARYGVIPDSEKAKSSSVCVRILNDIAAYDRKKSIFIIAFGGGVVGDVAGFAASVYRRGVPYIQVPTTLLSQVDSAIGGKCAIDLSVGKNLVGSFYQPRLVISDISLLKSLPASEIRNGLSETVKYGIIKDAPLFAYLEEGHKRAFKCEAAFLDYVISKCSRIKSGIVQKDERDKKDVRIALNYGHTIGHAVEAAGDYRRYTHGEAVAIGMVVEALLAYKLNLLKRGAFLRIESLLGKIGLPTRLGNVRLSRVLEAQEHDKKIITGVNRFVLPTRIGAVRICENIPASLVAQALEERSMA